MYAHHENFNIKDETNAAMKLLRYHTQPCNEQLDFYYNNGYKDYDNYVVCTTFCYRPNSYLHNIMSLWCYYEVQKWTDCCQICAPYCHWLFNLKPDFIDHPLFGPTIDNYKTFESYYLFFIQHSYNY
jgi:hypothetical protein